MKKGTIRLLAVAVMMATLLAFPAYKLSAVTEGTVVLGNVLGSGVTTLVRGLLQGRVHSFKDAVKCLAYGSASGYGFYQSKKLIAADRVFSGVLLANLSASVIDNVTSGEGPLSYIGFSLPLVRIEIATPLARQKRSLLRATVSPRDAISLALSLSKSDRMMMRNGMLAFEADTPLAANVRGWAYSVFPTMLTGTNDSVYQHEMVHVVQSLQLMAASPEPLLQSHRRDGGKAKFLSFAGFRIQALGLANDLTMAKLQSYNKYWREAEAYSLVKSL
jgi:hypothetical protein